MPLPDDDRRAIEARLATAPSGIADAVADAIDDDEELREVLVDVDGEVVVLTGARALFVRGGVPQAFAYDAIDVRRRVDGLGIDAVVEGARLVLHVARSTFVRLGVLAEGVPPSRATWLPVRAPVRRPRPEPVPPAPGLDPASFVPSPPDASSPPAPYGTLAGPSGPPPPGLPPPGWHPDPSGRHWWLWWDGGDWTDHVADGGAPYVDPLPPR